MKTNKVTAIVVGALLLFGVAWFPLMPSAQPEAPKVGIGTFSQAIDYGPMYVARHFRWFEQALKKAGAGEPVYLELGGFDEIQTAFAQRKLHAFFSAEAPVIKLVSEGQDALSRSGARFSRKYSCGRIATSTPSRISKGKRLRLPRELALILAF